MVCHISCRTDVSAQQLEEYRGKLSGLCAEDLIKEFLSYLDVKEESDNGYVFSPVTIGCTRVMLGVALEEVLLELRRRDG